MRPRARRRDKGTGALWDTWDKSANAHLITPSRIDLCHLLHFSILERHTHTPEATHLSQFRIDLCYLLHFSILEERFEPCATARIQGQQRQQGHQGRAYLSARERTLTEHGDVPVRSSVQDGATRGNGLTL